MILNNLPTWKSRHRKPPKEGERCIVVDRRYGEIFFDVAQLYDDGQVRFYDKGDEFYMYESEIITEDTYKIMEKVSSDY